jgi:hypothetical protein
MAAEFRSGSILSRTTRTNSTITAPAGIQDGDVLLIIFEIAAATPPGPPTPTAPAGFALSDGGFPATNTDGAFISNVYVWSKVASSEAGNYTVTHSSSISSAYMLAASGAAAVSPLDPTATIGEGGDTGTTATAPGLTTIVTGSLIVWWLNSWDLGLVAPPGGATPTFTTRYDPEDAVLHVGTGVLTPAGATGNKVATIPVSGSPWSTGLVAIKAAAAPASGGIGSRFDDWF